MVLSGLKSKKRPWLRATSVAVMVSCLTILDVKMPVAVKGAVKRFTINGPVSMDFDTVQGRVGWYQTAVAIGKR